MYAAPLVMVATAVLAIGVLRQVHRVTAIWSTSLVVLPFQSGWQAQEHALSRFHVRWYLATLVFLAFDVEMLFMYPWALVVADVGASSIVEMFTFLGALLVAVLWARREGALRWV